MKSVLAIVLLALGAGALAQDPASEKSRIQAERRRIEAQRASEEAACRTRFAVTDCLEDVRRRWRGPLADLRRQEVALDDAERQRRGAQQRADVEQRQAEAQQEQAQRRARVASEQREREERAAAKAAGPTPGGSPRPPAAAASGPRFTPQQEAENARARAARVDSAREHKEAVQRRQAERKREAARPLPVPP